MPLPPEFPADPPLTRGDDGFSFGRFRVVPASRQLMQDGLPLKLGARAFDVLQLLVAQRHRVVTNGELLQVAWPGLVVDENNLQVQVSALRRVLGPDVISTVSRRGYRFTATVDGDVLHSAAPAPLSAAPAEAQAVAAVGVLRLGTLEIRADEGSVMVDGVTTLLRPHAMQVLIALAQQAGRPVSKQALMARVWPEGVVTDNHLAVHVAALRKLVGPGAIATVPGQGYVFTLGVAAEPAREPQALPAARSRGNLPQRLLPLLGRQPMLAQLDRALAQSVLVSLCGPGGIGKTRLAEAVAFGQRERWADGVWFVGLAGLSDPDGLPGAVAQSLGLSLAGRAAALAELAAALQPLQMLLVLDNCEHLLGAVAALARTFASECPQVRLLTTSRVPLHVPGEQVFRVEPLSLPADGESWQGRAAAGAVQLFVERARAATGHFELDATNVAAVVDICTQLDGLPLAIELAAARTPLLGLEGLRSLLDERFALLRAAHPAGTSRHKTLLAAFDWSHDQLSPAQQAVYRRLGVFSGGFTTAMAQQVVADASMDRWAVLDHLDELVDKSLVVADGSDPPRCRLLETTRAHALAHLASAGESEPMAQRHLEVLTAFVDQALVDRDQGLIDEYRFVERLMPELDNVRDAFEAAVRLGLHTQALILADASGLLLFMLGRAPEALRRLRVAEPLADQVCADSPLLAARLWRRLGRCGINGRLPDALAIGLLRRAYDAFERADDSLQQHECLWMWAEALEDTRDAEGMASLLGQAAALESPQWHPIHRIRRGRVEAMLQVLLGRVDGALELLGSTLDAASACGAERQALVLRSDLAKLLMDNGRVAEAAENYRIVVERTGQRAADRINHADGLIGASTCAVALGWRAEGVDSLQRATTMWRQSGLLLPRGARIAWVLAAMGEDRSAACWLGAVDRHLADLGNEQREPRFKLALQALQGRHAAADIGHWLAQGRGMQVQALTGMIESLPGLAYVECR